MTGIYTITLTSTFKEYLASVLYPSMQFVLSSFEVTYDPFSTKKILFHAHYCSVRGRLHQNLWRHQIALEINFMRKGSVTLTLVVPSYVIWNKFHCLPMELFPSFFPVNQLEAWNVFEMTSDGATHFNVTKP